jgi:predicted metal-dependent hydrolase
LWISLSHFCLLNQGINALRIARLGGAVKLGGKPVQYSIRTSAGATRRRIRVTPNGIEVVIPRGGKAESASEFLQENEKWVLEQLDFVERSSGIFRDQVQPRSLLVRGQERTVRVVAEKTTRNYGLIDEQGDEVIVRVPVGKRGIAARPIELWLRRLARADLQASLASHARQMKLKFGRVFIMNQRTRWGGCSSRRNLSFSWRLIMAPPKVLDYMAVHELAHLVEPNHSVRFWLTVRSFCPEFEEHRTWLRNNEWRLRIPPLA